MYSSLCYNKCNDNGGEWDYYRRECIVTMYLVGFCYRVNYRDGWQLDLPSYVFSLHLTISTWSLSGSGVGCYYNNNYSPVLYSKTYSSVLPIHIRYYKDSFISADETTQGCSSSSTSSTTCFGVAADGEVGGYISIVLGGVVLCFGTFISIGRDFNDKEDNAPLLPDSNTAVPTATHTVAMPATTSTVAMPTATHTVAMPATTSTVAMPATTSTAPKAAPAA